MRHRPSKAWDAIHDEARRSLLLAEERLRDDMRSTIRACRARHEDEAEPKLAAALIASAMRRELPAVILRGRINARQASALALARQTTMALRMGVRGLPPVATVVATPTDERRALYAARSIAAAWLRSALEGIDARRGRRTGR